MPRIPQIVLAVPLLAGLAACSSAPAPLPAPRSLVIFSGDRLTADPAEMEVVDAFVRRALENIEEDPSFLIRLETSEDRTLLWEGLVVNEAADTATVVLEDGHPDAVAPYQIYAHLHLMADRGALGEWIPGADSLEGFAEERAILQQISDVWFYGRAIYDTAPYTPLDHLLWASESGYLDAYILSLRGDEFPEDRSEWSLRNAGGLEEYRSWFERTFGAAPPASR